MTSDIETPIYNNFNSTHRSLCGDSVENLKVLSKIDLVKVLQESDIKENPNDLFLTENFRVLNHLKCKDKCDHTLLDKDYSTITDREELKKLMSEVLIRFDTSPNNYMRADYLALLKLILSLFLTTIEENPEIKTETPELITVKNDKTSTTINLNISDSILDTPDDKNNTKIATVELIRNYINNKLTWKIL